MSLVRSVLLVVVATSVVVACKRELSDTEACDRIAALPGSTWSAADKDSCYLTYNVVGPNVRTCTDQCVRTSPSAADYEDCHDDCTGASYPSFLVCQKTSGSAPRFDACTKKHDPLMSEAKERYKCWSRCGRRAVTAAEADACDRTCGIQD